MTWSNDSILTKKLFFKVKDCLNLGPYQNFSKAESEIVLWTKNWVAFLWLKTALFLKGKKPEERPAGIRAQELYAHQLLQIAASFHRGLRALPVLQQIFQRYAFSGSALTTFDARCSYFVCCPYSLKLNFFSFRISILLWFATLIDMHFQALFALLI